MELRNDECVITYRHTSIASHCYVSTEKTVRCANSSLESLLNESAAIQPRVTFMAIDCMKVK